jgi:hypothetical protein
MSRTTLSIIAAGLIAATTIGIAAEAATLADGARAAIEAALDDEHRASFYAAVMTKFGDVRPFRTSSAPSRRMHPN